MLMPDANNDNRSKYAYTYTDGGLFDNRPACASIQHLTKGYNRKERQEFFDHTIVCSMNFSEDVGKIPVSLNGKIPWAVYGKIVQRVIKNKEMSNTNEMRLNFVEGKEFFEILIPINQDLTQMDNISPENIAKLIKIGKEYVENNLEKIQKLCQILLANLAKTNALTLSEQELEFQHYEKETYSELVYDLSDNYLCGQEALMKLDEVNITHNEEAENRV